MPINYRKNELEQKVRDWYCNYVCTVYSSDCCFVHYVCTSMHVCVSLCLCVCSDIICCVHHSQTVTYVCVCAVLPLWLRMWNVVFSCVLIAQMLLNLHKKTWMHGLQLTDYKEHSSFNQKAIKVSTLYSRITMWFLAYLYIVGDAWSSCGLQQGGLPCSSLVVCLEWVLTVLCLFRH